MWIELEEGLKTIATGAIPGAQVFGSFDPVDFSSPNAPPLSIQVLWRGFPPGARKPYVLAGTHGFAVVVTALGLRAKAAEQRRLSDGLRELHERLMQWRPKPAQPDYYPEIEGGAVVDTGLAWQYQINLTLPGYVIKAPPAA